MQQAKTVLGDNVIYEQSGDNCIKNSQVIIIVNSFKELHHLNWAMAADKTIIDCWRCLNMDKITKIKNYIPLGQGIKKDSNTFLNKITIERLRLLTD